MKAILRRTALLLPLLILLGAVPPLAAPSLAQARHYVCVPCALPCDTSVYDHPGICPACGMPLVDADSLKAAQAHLPPHTKVGILIFNSVEIIDYTGPWEIFGDAGFDVYTVALTRDPVTTAMGMTVVPRYTFADAPQPDILLVPGGGVRGARNSAETLKWVKATSAGARYTLSVCNGAFILAAAGLLDGLTATTTAHLIDPLRQQFPKVKVVDNRRFVDNGRVITAAGLSSGIDGALHVVSLLKGRGTAQKVALDEEYDWGTRSGYARAALADMQIPNVDMDTTGDWRFESTQGNTDHWVMVLRGTSTWSARQLLDHVSHDLETNGGWKRVGLVSAEKSASGSGRWTFRGRDGKPWTGALKLGAARGATPGYEATLEVARAGP